MRVWSGSGGPRPGGGLGPCTQDLPVKVPKALGAPLPWLVLEKLLVTAPQRRGSLLGLWVPEAPLGTLPPPTVPRGIYCGRPHLATRDKEEAANWAPLLRVFQ